jgi:hypothetical protein
VNVFYNIKGELRTLYEDFIKTLLRFSGGGGGGIY